MSSLLNQPKQTVLINEKSQPKVRSGGVLEGDRVIVVDPMKLGLWGMLICLKSIILLPFSGQQRSMLVQGLTVQHNFSVVGSLDDAEEFPNNDKSFHLAKIIGKSLFSQLTKESLIRSDDSLCSSESKISFCMHTNRKSPIPFNKHICERGLCKRPQQDCARTLMLCVSHHRVFLITLTKCLLQRV